MTETLLSFLHDLKIGARSLWRAKGLTLTVIATMALGIGANAAMFSLVRAVLLRPLVNRDEDHLILSGRARKAWAAKTRPSRCRRSPICAPA